MHSMTDEENYSQSSDENELIKRLELAEDAKRLLEGNEALRQTVHSLWEQLGMRLFEQIDMAHPEMTKQRIFQARLEMDALQNVINRLAAIYEDGRDVANELRELRRGAR